MALNPNISLAVRGVELQDPLAQYGKFAAIQGAQQQNQLAQMQMQKGQREQEDLNRLRMLDPSAPGYINEVTRINPQLGSELGLRKQQQTTAERQATSADAEIRGKNLSYWQSSARDASRSPTDDVLKTLAQQGVVLGLTDEATAGSRLQQLLALPLEKRAEILRETGAPASEPNKPAPPPAKVAEYRFAQTPEGGGYRGTYQQFIENQARAGRSEGARVYMPPQPKAELEKRGEMLVTEYSDISKAAKVAAKILPSIDANLGILGKGFETGFGTEAVAAGASVLAALGVPEAEKFATNAQVFQSKATEAVLQKQLEQKGPQTESDAQRIDQIGAQLGKTTEGNKFLLTTAKEQLKRDMEQRNFYDSWWKQNKTYDGAEDAWYSGEGGKSLFDRPTLKKYLSPTSSGAAIPGQTLAIPQAAIDKLKAGLGTDAQFDQMFGAGQAKRARGGK